MNLFCILTGRIPFFGVLIYVFVSGFVCALEESALPSLVIYRLNRPEVYQKIMAESSDWKVLEKELNEVSDPARRSALKGRWIELRDKVEAYRRSVMEEYQQQVISKLKTAETGSCLCIDSLSVISLSPKTHVYDLGQFQRNEKGKLIFDLVTLPHLPVDKVCVVVTSSRLLYSAHSRLIQRWCQKYFPDSKKQERLRQKDPRFYEIEEAGKKLMESLRKKVEFAGRSKGGQVLIYFDPFQPFSAGQSPVTEDSASDVLAQSMSHLQRMILFNTYSENQITFSPINPFELEKNIKMDEN